MYNDYIDGLNLTEQSVYGQCEYICKKMVAKFPELLLIKGYYWDSMWGRREHLWIGAPDGTILDPTAIQFPSKGSGHYEPLTDGDPRPTGKCPHCGEYCYDNEAVHEDCSDAFLAYLNG